MNQRLPQRVIASKATLPVVVVFAALWWMSGPTGSRWSSVVCIASCVVAVYLLVEVNHAFSLLNRRTTIHASLFLLLWTLCPSAGHLPEGCLTVAAVTAMLYFLFHSYQAPEPVTTVFLLFLTAGIASLFSPGMVWLVPLWYLFLAVSKALTPRTFFAGLTGLLMPYWVVFAYAFYRGEMELFLAPVQALAAVPRGGYGAVSLGEWLSLGYVSLLSLAATVHGLLNGHLDKIRTRSFLRFLMWLQAAGLLLALWQPARLQVWLGVMSVGAALLGGHLFALSTPTRGNTLLFVVSFLLLFIISCCNLWIPSYSFF